MRYSYQMYEMAYLALAPARAISDATRVLVSDPSNPFSHTMLARNIAASAELFERMTRRYGKPSFGLTSVSVDGSRVPVAEAVVWQRTFCRLLHFVRDLPPGARPQPRLLIIAPMSGHFATLLRGTVETFLTDFDVYVTEWTDARTVPLKKGGFDLDDFIDYLIEIMRFLRRDGQNLHTLAVCQPAVPLIAAVARMEAQDDAASPTSMTLMGGPIDSRRSPTAVNLLAHSRGVDWFRNNCIVTVPYQHAGFGRQVYPGFLQLSGFMAMNFERHVTAHLDMFKHLVKGDGDSAEKHREFYDEYLAVMDLCAEYYLQTIEKVFVEHQLPKGTFAHRGEHVDLAAIRHAALMTVEGENDDISGVGQTYAAHELCVGIPAERKMHHLQKGVGHYGVFNGSRFRSEIAPRIRDFIAEIERQERRGRISRPALQAV